MSTASARPGPRRIIGQITAVHPHRVRAAASLISLGTLAGLLEAAALVAFAQGAFGLSNPAPDPVALGPLQLLGAAGVLLVAAVAVHGLLARLSVATGLTVLNRLRARVLRAYRSASWERQSIQREGSLQEAVGQLSTRSSDSTNLLVDTASSIIMTGSIAVVAVLSAPAVSIMVIGALVPVTWLLRPLTLAARRRSKVSTAATTGFAEEVGATTALAKELRSFGVEHEQFDRLELAGRSAAADRARARFSNRFAEYLFRDVALLIVIAMVAVLSATVGLQSASTVAALLLLVRAFAYAQAAYGSYQHLMELTPAAELLFERITELESDRDATGDRSLTRIGRIELTAVSYRYEPSRPAVDGIDIVIEANRTVGLIGRSGAGKSTLAELLLRLRRPTAGTITVDGIQVQEFRATDWSRLVAYVPQDPQLWQRSVSENVTFLRPGFDRSEVIAALRSANVWDAVEALPDGLDTMLGPRSTGLSGGQRQRIAIARALLGAPQLLVLDEPTSALDAASEQLLQATLRSLHGTITMVIIAHRMSTLELCDQIVQLDGGRVIATGTWERFAGENPSLLPVMPD